MIAILKSGTTPEQREHLVNWLKRMNLDVHISQGERGTDALVEKIARQDIVDICRRQLCFIERT